MRLYYAPYSPPSQAVLLAAESIGILLDLKVIDVFKGEHQTIEYERICPEKKIPFLVDGNFKINESRAIMVYLFEKYGKNHKLYPAEPCGRALVNQALNFDAGILYSSITQYYFPLIFLKEEQSPERYEKLNDAFKVLNRMLDNQDYVAGRSLTLADLSIAASVNAASGFGYEWDTLENISKWLHKVKLHAPGYEKIIGTGKKAMKLIIDKQLTETH